MSKFVNFRAVQEEYRASRGIKQRMPREKGIPIRLDNGKDTLVKIRYEDGSIQTTSGDWYEGTASNGHQLHAINRKGRKSRAN